METKTKPPVVISEGKKPGSTEYLMRGRGPQIDQKIVDLNITAQQTARERGVSVEQVSLQDVLTRHKAKLQQVNNNPPG